MRLTQALRKEAIVVFFIAYPRCDGDILTLLKRSVKQGKNLFYDKLLSVLVNHRIITTDYKIILSRKTLFRRGR